jgi:hypothetical protein
VLAAEQAVHLALVAAAGPYEPAVGKARWWLCVVEEGAFVCWW